MNNRHGRATVEGRAFTLLELVVVLIIIGLLASLVVPLLARASERARTAAVCASLATLRNAFEQYGAEHNGRSPALSPQGVIEMDVNGLETVRRLLEPTGPLGELGVDGRCGGYIDRIPPNPLTPCGLFPIGAIEQSTDCAWRLDPETGYLRPDHHGALGTTW